ncbi:hypothetical protein ACFPOI_16205 [Nonomuraea angiospora]|uniref:Uncharacterized protein n=1 Tax=Nonomuraea angiospora TaxID=46172 RepID=A0ABR9MGX7_9ACTN|nr:hypothetical protein [Nonomuraea angiospora]MBE1592176.1 hypothetical protein [Nonomuraea angiospora]
MPIEAFETSFGVLGPHLLHPSALAATLTPMAADDSLPPMMRDAAHIAAGILWSDSGGW